MLKWLRAVGRDLGEHGRLLLRLLRDALLSASLEERRLLRWGLVCAAMTMAIGLVAVARVSYDVRVPRSFPSPDQDTPLANLFEPVREIPANFRPNTHLPRRSEGRASGVIDKHGFHPGFDLVSVEDPRVWWESEYDGQDTENDHLMHRAMEEPFLRLIELVQQRAGRIKVQDAYRDEGIHAARSLHKEGRAIDLTCEDMTLEDLAKLCWAAGFDWVYYEAPRSGGAHIHCSVRADSHD